MMPQIGFWMPDIGYWHQIDPDAPFQHALGGRETAMVRTAQELVKLGWDVTVVTAIDGPNRRVKGIEWIRTETLQDFTPDVLATIDRPSVFRRYRGKKLNIMAHQCASVQPGIDRVGRFDRVIDHYFVLTNYHRWSLCDSDRSIDPLKCVTFGNGIDLDRYEEKVEKVAGRLIWSSSHDRGLHHLIRIWPRLKERVPHATLKVFYDLQAMTSYKWTMEIRGEWVREIEQGKSYEGVEFVGSVDQKTLAREQLQAELFAYPCDPATRTETFAITVLENMAARTPCLLSTADCLEELYGNYAWFARCPIADNEWIAAIELLLTTPERLHQHVERARQFAEERTWANIAQRWDAFLRRRLELTDQEDIYELVEDASGAFASVR